MRTQIKIIITMVTLLFTLSLCDMSAQAEINIRPGAADEEASFWINGLQLGVVTPSQAQEIVDAGGFSDSVAIQVQEAINKATNNTSVPTTDSLTPEPNAKKIQENCLHDYTVTTKIEPNCVTPGQLTYTCTQCGDTYTVPLELIDHNYSTEITNTPTCTTAGEMTYTCSMCGDTYTEEIEPLEHNSGKWIITKEATCTTQGEKTLKCGTCNGIINTVAIPLAEHTPSDWEESIQATLFHKGEQIKKCTVCDTVLCTETTPILWGYWVVIGLVAILFIIVAIIAILRRQKR